MERYTVKKAFVLSLASMCIVLSGCSGVQNSLEQKLTANMREKSSIQRMLDMSNLRSSQHREKLSMDTMHRTGMRFLFWSKTVRKYKMESRFLLLPTAT